MSILENRLSLDSGSDILNKLGFYHSICVSSALLSVVLELSGAFSGRRKPVL